MLFLGDLVGSGSVKLACALAPRLKTYFNAPILCANGENAAGGSGITPALVQALYTGGVDGLTLGNHTWAKWELADWIAGDLRMARPANGHPAWPGRGYALIDTPAGRLGLLNLLGAVQMGPAVPPFDCASEWVPVLKSELGCRFLVVDFHAETTSEKIAMGYHLDGQVTAVLGTHTHVATADAAVLAGGTAYITDLGMCGPVDGVIGMDRGQALRRFTERLPARYKIAGGPIRLSGVVIDCDPVSGLAHSIRRFSADETGVVTDGARHELWAPEPDPEPAAEAAAHTPKQSADHPG